MTTILPNPASDLDQWNIVLAFAMPFVVALIHQPAMSKLVKLIITVGFCVLAATINTAIQQDLSLSNWLHSVLIVLVGAIGLYHTLYARVVPAVETATSKSTHPQPGPRG